MKGLLSKPVPFWIVVNAAFPLVIAGIIELVGAVPMGRILFLYGPVIVILAGNIYGLVRFPEARPWFIAIIVLNLFVFVMIGSISFVTSIPWLPLLFTSIYQLIVQ